jgi:hypothetical protein
MELRQRHRMGPLDCVRPMDCWKRAASSASASRTDRQGVESGPRTGSTPEALGRRPALLPTIGDLGGNEGESLGPGRNGSWRLASSRRPTPRGRRPAACPGQQAEAGPMDDVSGCPRPDTARSRAVLLRAAGRRDRRCSCPAEGRHAQRPVLVNRNSAARWDPPRRSSIKAASAGSPPRVQRAVPVIPRAGNPGGAARSLRRSCARWRGEPGLWRPGPRPARRPSRSRRRSCRGAACPR